MFIIIGIILAVIVNDAVQKACNAKEQIEAQKRIAAKGQVAREVRWN